MDIEPGLHAQFKKQLQHARAENERAWELSSKLVAHACVDSTLKRLAEAVRASALSDPLRHAVLTALKRAGGEDMNGLSSEALKRLTGLPKTKAIRALCVHFGLMEHVPPSPDPSRWSSADIEDFLRSDTNPYDFLLQAETPSVLDLGAGDLTFAGELVDQYLPRLRKQGKTLTVHAVDRIRPGSKLGGPLQPDTGVMEELRGHGAELAFRYWGNHDMFEVSELKSILPRYSLITCHAPATPTFAYEPSRIVPQLINAHLRHTKGEFKRIRFQGEDAIEVIHQGRSLVFPPWKFDIRGPLALLDLLSRYGRIGLLTSVDSQVFWEILSQLLADPGVRPPDTILHQTLIPGLFGPVYERLSKVPIGGSLILSDVADLRPVIPRVLPGREHDRPYRFRFLDVRRGAVLHGMPSSRTARLFPGMAEEEPPWCMILVPDQSIH